MASLGFQRDVTAIADFLGRVRIRYFDRANGFTVVDAADPQGGKVDFRCLRFPGLISATTMPSGGSWRSTGCR